MTAVVVEATTDHYNIIINNAKLILLKVGVGRNANVINWINSTNFYISGRCC